MTALFDYSILDTKGGNEKLPFECEWCHSIFEIEVKWIKSDAVRRPNKHKYCSAVCRGQSQRKTITENCAECSKEIYVSLARKRKSKSGKSFCSQSCRTKYHNKNKTTGTRRSKLEVWLEEQLTYLYPNLEIQFNKKETINSELDIYIPSIKLAFELNGIFHYEPIYGADKLSAIQNNDERKFQACLEREIELVIIDSSGLNYFKPSKAEKYLNIITAIIEPKVGVEPTKLISVSSQIQAWG